MTSQGESTVGKAVVEAAGEGIFCGLKLPACLFDRFARPLPFAPCLVTEEGKSPRPMRASGGSGADSAIIAIRHPKVPSKINVKWSRPNSSDGAGSPPPAVGDTFEFELDVTVEMPGPDEQSTAMDRLRNLGEEPKPSGRSRVKLRIYQED